jgi:hypothetical protein
LRGYPPTRITLASMPSKSALPANSSATSPSAHPPALIGAAANLERQLERPRVRLPLPSPYGNRGAVPPADPHVRTRARMRT